MPVAFRLGKEVANEFVDSLNAVDASYRSEFRELFDTRFGGLEARMAAFEARMDAKLAELKAELLRWMFLFWVGTMGTVLAIVKL
jgi:hypothetical protein